MPEGHAITPTGWPNSLRNRWPTSKWNARPNSLWNRRPNYSGIRSRLAGLTRSRDRHHPCVRQGFSNGGFDKSWKHDEPEKRARYDRKTGLGLPKNARKARAAKCHGRQVQFESPLGLELSRTQNDIYFR